MQICRDYFDRMYICESQKYDMEFECRKKDFEVWVEWLDSTPCLVTSPLDRSSCPPHSTPRPLVPIYLTSVWIAANVRNTSVTFTLHPSIVIQVYLNNNNIV